MATPKIEAIAARMTAAVKGYVERPLAPINTRLAAAESRVGALSLMLGREDSGNQLPELESLIARVKALEDRLGL